MNTNSTFQKLTVVFLLVISFFLFSVNAKGQTIAHSIHLQIDYAHPATCANSKDGYIEANAWGGSGTMQYSIDNGVTFQTNKKFNNLAVGTYKIIARDGDGCKSSTVTAVITYSTEITLQIDYAHPATCANSKDGYIEANAWGGTGLIQYSIDNGVSFQANKKFINLPSGMYKIIAKDADGCLSVYKTATVGGSFTALIHGDTTVESNATAYVKILITDYSGNPTSTLYTAKGVDNLGNSYTETNLKAGENLISVKPTQNITYTIQSIEMKSGSKCKGYATGNMSITINSKFVWTGKNTNWNDAANWSKKAVPSANSEVVIPVSAINPVITGNAYAKSISVDQGAGLQVIGVLHISEGILTNENESVNATEGTIEFCGISAQQLDGGIFVDHAVKSLIIGNRVDLTDSLNILSSVTFNGVNKIFNTNDMLTLKSTATETARVGKITDGNQVTGNVTVEQYLPARKGWKFLSVSTQSNQSIHAAWQEGQVAGNTTNIQGYGIQLTGDMNDWSSKGFDRKSAAPSIKTYDMNRNLWIGVPSTLSPFTNSSNAYMVFVRGDRSANATTSPESPTVLRTKGALKSGTQSTVSVPADKFVAVGNPYASPLDMSKIKTDGNTFFYIWDQNLGNSYGAYQTFMKISEGEYMAIPGGGTYTTLSENIIPAGQAFFVYNGNGDMVTIDENSKAAMNTFQSNSRNMATNSQVEKADQLNLKLYSVSNTGSQNLVDGIFQNFSREFNSSIDASDALKSANSGENLSVKTAGKLLAIESKSFSENNDTTLLNMSGMSYMTYRFEIEFNQVNVDRDAVLIDKYTNQRTNISPNSKTFYEFDVNKDANSSISSRFSIIYVPKRTLPVTFTSVKAEKKQESVNVSWAVEKEVNVKSYIIEKSLDGSSFTQIGTINSANVANYSFSDGNPANGINYYRVVSMDIDGRKGYTSVVKINMIRTNENVAVYPNPVVGNNIHLEMKFQAKGIYYISIKNQIGQVIHNSQVDFDGSKTNFDVNPSKKLSSGVYTIEIVLPSGDHSVVRFIK